MRWKIQQKWLGSITRFVLLTNKSEAQHPAKNRNLNEPMEQFCCVAISKIGLMHWSLATLILSLIGHRKFPKDIIVVKNASMVHYSYFEFRNVVGNVIIVNMSFSVFNFTLTHFMTIICGSRLSFLHCH